MWSALNEPAVLALLEGTDAGAREAIVEELRRTQGASWRAHETLGPRLAVLALGWWDGVAAAASVDRLAVESWMAMLGAFAPDPAAAAAAVHGFVRLRDLSKVLAYQRVLESFGGVLAGPMCAALEGLESPTRVFVVRWVAEHAPAQGERELLRCAGEASRGIREAALGGLGRLGARAIGGVATHLASSDVQVRRSAIAFLSGLAHPEALGPLRAALKKEKSSPLKTDLQKALLACGAALPSSAPSAEEQTAVAGAPSLLATIEAEPAPRLPRFVADLADIPLRIRAGGQLSDAAHRWLLYRLSLEQHDFADPESRKLRVALVDDDCHELSRRLAEAFVARGSRAADKWLIYQGAILGSEEQVLEGVDDLERRVSDNGFARATWTLDVLARHASPGALWWLEHFAGSARSEAVRDFATRLLRGVRAELGPDEVQRRVDAGLPTFPFDESGRWALGHEKAVTLQGDGRVELSPRKRGAFDTTELAEIARCRRTVDRAVRSLERAMCERRTWSADAFAAIFQDHPVVRVLARTLLFVDEPSTTLFRMHPTKGKVDVAGEPVASLSGAGARIVHPVQLRGLSTPAEYARWKEALASLGPPPFPQLEREVFALDGYRRGERGVELDGPSLPVSSTLALLQRRAWVTEEDADDTAWQTAKTLPDGWSALLTHTPIDVRFLGGRPGEDLADLGVEGGSFRFETLELEGPDGAGTWDAAPILVSEVLRDVELALRAGTPDPLARPSRAPAREEARGGGAREGRLGGRRLLLIALRREQRSSGAPRPSLSASEPRP